MLRQFAAVIVMVTAFGAPAFAATDPGADAGTTVLPGVTAEAVFRDFDLLGIWARDCGRPPSPTNPHVNVTAPGEGIVAEVHDVGPGYTANRYHIVAARRIDATSLQANVLFQPETEGEERQGLVLRIGKGTRRTIYNRVEDGDVRVNNGIAVFSGRQTPLLKRCGG